MTDEEKLDALDVLLSSGVLGIYGKQFVLQQTTLISAMQKTDRVFLLRILDRLHIGSKFEELLDESIELDKKHLLQIVESASKYIK